MTKSIRTALLFLAAAAAMGAAPGAEAQNRRAGAAARLQDLDADKSGDLTLDEFSALVNQRMKQADTDGDGRMTVGEVAAEIERIRNERAAQQLIKRFDADGDGVATKAEVDARQKARFDKLDADKDGKLTKDELPKDRKKKSDAGEQ